MRLTELGERICIIGPSNSGKSTLAEAIARKLRVKAIHLDQLHHLPNTDWKPRPADDFVALHDEVIDGDQWVIDGNYSKCFPQRFRRATGVILLDISTLASLFRYVRRTIIGGARAGALEGGQDSLKMNMFHHIAIVTPRNRKRYAEAYAKLDIPKICLASINAIDACYRDWDLERVPRA
jgi:adenylate kinase family enzyme